MVVGRSGDMIDYGDVIPKNTGYAIVANVGDQGEAPTNSSNR